MDLDLGKVFSASTAIILVDNVEVGQLQNLTVREEYDVKPVYELGSSISVAFVPGLYRGTVTARRALLEIDKVFQALAPGTDLASLQNLLNQVLPGSGSVIQTAVNLNDLIRQIANFFSAKTKREPYSQVITFTIKILDLDNHEQMRLEQCILTGRTLTVDVGALVVMQDLNIMYQKRVV